MLEIHHSLASPFSCKGTSDFWLGLSPGLNKQFEYLNLNTKFSTMPFFVSQPARTEQASQYETEVNLNLPDLISLSEPKSRQPSFRYDMTAYIHNSEKRYKDSIYMCHIIDSQWDLFSQDSSNIDSNYADISFQETFHGSRRCLQFLRTPEQIFKYYFTITQIAMPNSVNSWLSSSLQIVIPFFSHIKRYIHTNIDFLPPISYCYSELDTIPGYPLEEHRTLSDDPKLWLEKDVLDLHSPEWWEENITITLLKSKQQPKTLIPYSFYEFLSRPWLWITDGASSVSKLFLNGEKVKTKFGAAVSLTPQELLFCVYHALNPKTYNIDIFIKQDERGYKRRLIANMDLGSYLVAAYVRYLLEWLDGPIPDWMTATTTANLDLKVIKMLRNGKRSIPLDESQFDHHLSRHAWLGFLKSLDFIFPNNFGIHLFHVLFQNSKFFDRTTNTHGLWLKGMPSGLAITSIGNTLFNYVKQNAISSPIHFALGDDVLLFSEKGTLQEISDYYNTFGAEVNAKKNWTSTQYAEFLHFLYSSHARVGLPARIYGSLMYGLQFKDTSPLQRLNELTQLFKDFYDRACLPFDFELVAADLSRAVSHRWARFSKAVAKTWLHIPKALNGFGFLPYVPLGFKIRDKTFSRKYYSNALIELPSVVEVTDSDYTIYPFKLTGASYKLGNTLKLPEIQSMKEWEDRLNLRHPVYSPTMLKWAGETIPLPEINYVSSSRMSNFASMWKFNAFPNLRGNAITRTSRFIKASLMLATEVGSWLSKNSIYVYV